MHENVQSGKDHSLNPQGAIEFKAHRGVGAPFPVYGGRVLHFLASYCVGLKVPEPGALMGADSLRIHHHKGGNAGGFGGIAMLESNSQYAVEHKSRPPILLHMAHVDMVQLDPAGMPDEESVSGQNPEHGGLGIFLLALGCIVRLARRYAAGSAKEERIHQVGWLSGDLVEGQPAAVENPDAAQLDT